MHCVISLSTSVARVEPVNAFCRPKTLLEELQLWLIPLPASEPELLIIDSRRDKAEISEHCFSALMMSLDQSMNQGGDGGLRPRPGAGGRTA